MARDPRLFPRQSAGRVRREQILGTPRRLRLISPRYRTSRSAPVDRQAMGQTYPDHSAYIHLDGPPAFLEAVPAIPVVTHLALLFALVVNAFDCAVIISQLGVD